MEDFVKMPNPTIYTYINLFTGILFLVFFGIIIFTLLIKLISKITNSKKINNKKVLYAFVIIALIGFVALLFLQNVTIGALVSFIIIVLMFVILSRIGILNAKSVRSASLIASLMMFVLGMRICYLTQFEISYDEFMYRPVFHYIYIVIFTIISLIIGILCYRFNIRKYKFLEENNKELSFSKIIILEQIILLTIIFFI